MKMMKRTTLPDAGATISSRIFSTISCRPKRRARRSRSAWKRIQTTLYWQHPRIGEGHQLQASSRCHQFGPENDKKRGSARPLSTNAFTSNKKPKIEDGAAESDGDDGDYVDMPDDDGGDVEMGDAEGEMKDEAKDTTSADKPTVAKVDEPAKEPAKSKRALLLERARRRAPKKEPASAPALTPSTPPTWRPMNNDATSMTPCRRRRRREKRHCH